MRIVSDSDTWFNNPVIQHELVDATIETLLMTGIASAVAAVLGLLLGILLTATRKGGIREMPVVYYLLSTIVDIGRSIPFIILMFVLIPVSRFIAGTATDWQGASVPLAIAAIPYFARLVESNLCGVEQGKIEAAYMMGASNSRIMWGVVVKEAVPTLIQSLTILIITLIGYSAMAGAVGGGGLGALAVNHGYYNWNPDVLTILVVEIILIVTIIQVMGNMLSRLANHR